MKLLAVIIFTFSMCFAHAKSITLRKNNTVVMNEAFNASSVAKVQQQLLFLALKTKKDIYLVLNTPGGSVSAGQELIHFANNLPNKVHTITVFAASMGYLTAQHLGKRYIVPHGAFMSHRASISGLSGQVPGEANSRLKYISQQVKELSINTAKRVGVSYKSYMSSIYNELWLTANEAVRLNHADEVVNVKCDKSLSKTHIKNIRTDLEHIM